MKITRVAVAALGFLALSASLAQAAIQIGTKVEPFTLKDLEGKDVSIAFDNHKVSVVSFWVSTCTLCKAELKVINDLSDKFKDVNFVVVSTDFGGPRLVNYVLKETGVVPKVPILMDTASTIASKKYGVTRFPFLMMVNKEGTVVWYSDGWEADSEQRITAEIEYRNR